MGFRMNCDRCGRFIRNLSIEELKKHSGSKEILCTPCQTWEKRSQASVEEAVDRMKGDLEKYKQTFVNEIRDICNASRVEED